MCTMITYQNRRIQNDEQVLSRACIARTSRSTLVWRTPSTLDHSSTGRMDSGGPTARMRVGRRRLTEPGRRSWRLRVPGRLEARAVLLAADRVSAERGREGTRGDRRWRHGAAVGVGRPPDLAHGCVPRCCVTGRGCPPRRAGAEWSFATTWPTQTAVE